MKSPLETEVANLIIEALNLEDIEVDDIEPEAVLFGDGLGLDSIDALELSMAISQRYGLQIKSGDSENQRIFSSLRALSQFIEAHRSN